MALRLITMVTVQVRQFDLMVAWYRDTLGLTVVWMEPNEFCTLAAPGGGPVLALATDHPDRIGSQPGAGWTPTFSVDDFDVTVAQLQAAGVTFEAPEEGADEGYRLIRLRDPEGNPIGITA
jgi:catechol 2,3-dioxygenase-like lactoylglutathione lyase family enzyme